MTVSKRRASTVYNRSNFTIVDVTDLSAPTTMEYHPDDFFPFYDIIFAVDQGQTGWNQSIQFMFLFSMAAFLESGGGGGRIDSGGGPQLRLHEFLATPLAIFNDAWQRNPTDDMGKSFALAIPSYRVHHTHLNWR
jgi:hypothetical protein